MVIFGGGHAASIVIRAAKKGLVKPKVIAAVAPTWAGPLPIVFGRDSSMETRYFMPPYIEHLYMSPRVLLYQKKPIYSLDK